MPLFFSAGEQEMIINAYEVYKIITMAKSNTTTAARARQEAVYGAVYGVIYMYVYITTSVTVVQRVKELFSSCKVASSILLTKCIFTFPCKIFELKRLLND